MDINNLIQTLLFVEQQTRIMHWNTSSYSYHISYGNFYNDFSDLIDDFIEVYMGKFGTIKYLETDLKLSHAIDMMQLLNITVNELEQLDNKLELKDTDLLNIRDEMLSRINKLKYHLSLT